MMSGVYCKVFEFHTVLTALLSILSFFHRSAVLVSFFCSPVCNFLQFSIIFSICFISCLDRFIFPSLKSLGATFILLCCPCHFFMLHISS